MSLFTKMGKLFGGSNFRATLTVGWKGSFSLSLWVDIDYKKKGGPERQAAYPMIGWQGKLMVGFTPPRTIEITGKMTMHYELGGNKQTMSGGELVTFSLAVTLTIRPPEKVSIKVEGAVSGCIRNLLGYKGFNLCDAGLAMEINILDLAAGNIFQAVNMFRLEGEMQWGTGNETGKLKLLIHVDTKK